MYIVVKNNILIDLIEEVNSLEGFEPIGGLCADGTYYLQAMVGEQKLEPISKPHIEIIEYNVSGMFYEMLYVRYAIDGQEKIEAIPLDILVPNPSKLDILEYLRHNI